MGQLGLGENILEKSKPGFVEVVGKDIIQVVAGGMHTACLTANGEVSPLYIPSGSLQARHQKDTKSEKHSYHIRTPNFFVQNLKKLISSK